jgi:hypothetical protein
MRAMTGRFSFSTTGRALMLLKVRDGIGMALLVAAGSGFGISGAAHCFVNSPCGIDCQNLSQRPPSIRCPRLKPSLSADLDLGKARRVVALPQVAECALADFPAPPSASFARP